MSRASKQSLIDVILFNQLGPSASWSPPDQVPLLGDRYAREVEIAGEFLGRCISEQRNVLKGRSLDDLRENYDDRGFSVTEAETENWASVRSQMSRVLKSPRTVQAGLGNPDYAAEYEYWSRMDWFSVREAVWLSVGLEPRFDWEGVLSASPARNRAASPHLQHAKDLTDQLERFARRSMMDRGRLSPGKLLAWMVESEFPTTAAFIGVLKKAKERTSLKASSTNGDNEKLDKREVATVAKAITALAIDGYGYQPNSKRSPIPGELEGVCDRLGLSVSRETILKYLRMGSKFLNENETDK